ncbi:flagellar filament capping protein FliD [Solimonas variicoloris]|uniref:flagellar filament capping protein FliD n=1 Tax=Solimonas variicoloris TaxID=254408 RepID=UPI00037D393B|nr:flagellar filament capping protein FliD [Solimonas variicoloris]
MGITSAGVGSGLDIESLITKLVSAERSPTETRLTTKRSVFNTQLSAVGTFKSVLSTLQTKLAALKSGGELMTLSATSSDTDILGVSTSSTATRGNYQVEVQSLAKSHKLASSAFAGADATLGAGEVTIGVAGKSFKVTLGDTQNTLVDLKNAINKATDNTGVTATLISESGGTRLVLSSNETGAANAITVSSSLLGFTEQQAAQDAHVRIDGYDVYSASNSVSDAIDGVTLKLQKAEPGTTLSLDVALDTDAAAKTVQSFVNAYNAAIGTMASLTRYDAGTKTAAVLNGDAMVRGAAGTLRGILAGAGASNGSYQYLAQIGITAKADGTLEVDSEKLSDALADDSAAVQKLFAGDGGYATRLDAAIEKIVGDDGQVEARNDALQARLDTISDQLDGLDARMVKVEARYRQQYTSLDALLASMQSTSSYLSQQLSALSKLSSSSSSASG